MQPTFERMHLPMLACSVMSKCAETPHIYTENNSKFLTISVVRQSNRGHFQAVHNTEIHFVSLSVTVMYELTPKAVFSLIYTVLHDIHCITGTLCLSISFLPSLCEYFL